MRTLLLLCLLSLAFGSQAAIYKWVDSRGNVHYSDTPTRDAEEVELSDPTVYTPPKSTTSGGRGTNEPVRPPEQTGYASFQIVSPGNQETLHANDRRVTIQFQSEPPLRPGHYIQPVLDGRTLDRQLAGNTLQLTDVDRGTHMIHATIHDAAGQPLARSNIVEFHVRQTSILQGGGAAPPPANNN